MSASNKKKLRKELNAAAMTEKQQHEAKEAKKLRLQTIGFTALIALMVVVAIVTMVTSSGIIERNKTAVTVDGTKINAAELKHYYIDSVNKFYNQYGNYASLLGLDVTKPLDEQIYSEEENTTWADYFLESALDSIRYMYALYNAATEAGYTLDEEGELMVQNNVDTMTYYGLLSGYDDADSYINAVYGAGCNEDTFRNYCTVQYIASAYADDHQASLTYTNEDLREKEAENFNAYTSYTYNYYYLPVSSFLEGGTKDENDKLVYSDEEKAAAQTAAEAAANSLLTASGSVKLFDEAIAGLSINADSEGAKSTRHEDYLYDTVSQYVSEDAHKWIIDNARVEGDMTVIVNQTTSTAEDGTETTTVNGYYVFRYDGKDDNLVNLINVRHILIAPEGGKYDSTTGTTTYTDEEKAAAKAKAEELLAQFQAGEVTEDAFAALAKEHSTDDGSKENGGLYEDVYPGQMVPNFDDWCFDASRQTGDTGIVESDYGYHIMYFVGHTETTFRDFMIENDLISADMTAWEDGLYEAAELVTVDTGDVKLDIVLKSN